MYVPYGDVNYACDFGDPAFRQVWIDEARATFQRGNYRLEYFKFFEIIFRGVFIAFVELSFIAIKNQGGNWVVPLDKYDEKLLFELFPDEQINP